MHRSQAGGSARPVGPRPRRRGTPGASVHPGRWFLATLALLLGGCGAGQGPEEERAAEIAVQRAIWEATRPARYRMVLRHLCFCPPDAIGPVEVVVEGETVVRRSYRESGEAVDSSLAGLFPSVSGLFDLLEAALTEGADQVDVTWDPETGAPLHLFIDYDVGVADEERGYRVEIGPEPLGR